MQIIHKENIVDGSDAAVVEVSESVSEQQAPSWWWWHYCSSAL